MSTTTETTSASSSESKVDSATSSSQTSASAAAAGSTQSTTSTGSEGAQADAFDAESLELSFGLPPGSLKDVKDEKSAIEAVRSFTDKILTAGLGFASAATTETKVEKPVVKAEEKPAEKAAAAATGANAEIDSLRAELREVKGMLTEQSQRQHQNGLLELDRRVEAKIDSWASPKYGVKGNRNYKQTKAAKEFKDVLIPNLLAGRQAAGLPINQQIEVYMEQLRLHDDENYTPSKKDGDKSAALGTAGAQKAAAGAAGAAPRSIHQALINNAS